MASISLFRSLFIVSCLLWFTSAFAPSTKASAFLSRAAPNLLPPSKDPFYSAPPSYQNAAPGAVLRVRLAPGLSSVIANTSAAYNILYRTTDSNYQPSWAVTTLYVPQVISGGNSNATNSTSGNSSTSGIAPGTALLSYQVPYDSANIDQSPSYTFYGGAADPSIPVLLGQGVFVNVPDYEGPLASFTAGVQSGHATLDSVRAVLNSGFGLANNAKYALWGYSGGALASEWAAELQVQYAPELNVAGVALGGLTPNVSSVTFTVNETPGVELVPNGILGLASQYPAALQFLVSQLKTTGPYNATKFLSVRNVTTTVDASLFGNQNIFDYFQDGAAVVQNPLVQQIINRDGIMGYHGVPQMPVFAYKAIGDEISVVADSDALIDRYCAVGANILYQRNTVGGHVAEFVNGLPRALNFLTSVFDGSYASNYNSSGCTIQNVTVAIDNSPS